MSEAVGAAELKPLRHTFQTIFSRLHARVAQARRLRVKLVMNVVLIIAGAIAHVPLEQSDGGHETHMQRVRRKGWSDGGRAPSHLQLDLIVAVRQNSVGVATLEKTLMRVSDPDAKAYGQHLTHRQVDDLVAPSAAAVQAVHGWLRSHGVASHNMSLNGDFIGFTSSVRVAESLLGTRYHTFEHTSGTSVVRSTEYGVPPTIAPFIDFVAPTITFPPVSAKSASHDGAFKVTPAFLRRLYGLGPTDIGRGAASNNSQAVASFLKQYYSPADLSAFWSKYPPPAKTPVVDVPASQPHTPVGTEAALDSQYLPSLGAGISTQVWSTEGVQPGAPANEPFIKWLANVAASEAPPRLFSISYGDEENGVSRTYASRCNIEFQKAGARGISLLVSSGDSGAGCASTGFVPTFPASSPWVTAVGGVTGHSAPGETTAALSGGGFSDYFRRPAYQDAAVAAYLTQPGLPRSHMYNASGAGFPDISAQALQFDTCTDNFFYPVDGTYVL